MLRSLKGNAPYDFPSGEFSDNFFVRFSRTGMVFLDRIAVSTDPEAAMEQ